MKRVPIIMLVICMHITAFAQSQGITLSEKNASLKKIFSSIEKQTGKTFYYNDDLLARAGTVSITVKDASLTEVLDQCFKNLPITYEVIGKTIVLKEKRPSANSIDNPGVSGLSYAGVVVSEDGTPLEGVTVTVKGTRKAIATNSLGAFLLPDIKMSDILVLTGINIETKEAPVKDYVDKKIVVQEKTSQLDQIQILAYSTTTKRLNPGNVTTIKAEDIAKHPVPNVLQAIQGRVPGMFVVQQTGLPGGAFDVKIRGVQSFNGTSPLVIVDGVDFSSSFTNTTTRIVDGTLPLIPGINGTRNFLRGGNALNYLDPNEIESVDVLKDAAATAVYGSRGAYGVILITTKKAKAGRPTLSLNAYTGIDRRGTFPRLLNTQEYLMIRREALKNDGVTPKPTDYDVNGTWPEDRYTDWQEELTGKYALHSKVSLSYGGGNNAISYRFGGHYSAEKNVQKGKGGNKEGGMSLNLHTSTSNNKLRLDFSANLNSTLNDMVPFDFSNDFSTIVAPNAPPLFLPDGSLNWETGSNPAAAINLIYKQRINNGVASLQGHYIPLKDLSINIRLGYETKAGKELFAQPSTYFIPTSNSGTQTKSNFGAFSNHTWMIEPNVSYSKGAGRKGVITAIAGTTIKNVINQRNGISGSNFATDALLKDPALGGTVTAYYSEELIRYFGSFAQLKYDWAHKYILEFSGRYDGSTKFGPNERFGAFGAVAGNWIISEEPWFKNGLSFISFAKIRGSYGTVGGDGIASYQYLTRYEGSAAYIARPTLIVSTLRNPTLHWENKRQLDFGGSLEFLKGRIYLEGSYSRSRSSDLLVAQPLSGVTGYTSLVVNTDALIQNTSIEGSLTSKNINGRNFTWTTNMNITVPGSKLLALPNAGIIALGSNYALNKPVTGVYVYKFAGVNPQTGNYNFYNAKGQLGEFPAFGGPPGTVPLNQGDKTEFIDLAPKFYGSIFNSLRYKKLTVDIQVFVNNRIGKNYLGSQLYTPGTINMNPSKDALRRWQKPGDITGIPRATQSLTGLLQQNNFSNSTGAYERAMYARLQNVNISYDLSSGLQKFFISKMNVYLQGQNLWTLSKYKDLDPENLLAGSMPPLRTFIAGVNVSF